MKDQEHDRLSAASNAHTQPKDGTEAGRDGAACGSSIPGRSQGKNDPQKQLAFGCSGDKELEISLDPLAESSLPNGDTGSGQPGRDIE